MLNKLSAVTAKLLTGNEAIDADKPKVPAGIDTDGSVFQITLPLLVKESDITVSKAKKPNTGEEYDKTNVCFKFEAKGLHIGVQMDDGSIRYYKVKNNAGPYGATRYISLGFDPTVFFTRPPAVEPETEVLTEHVPPMANAASESEES